MQVTPGEAEILRFIEGRHGRQLDALERADVLAALDLDGAAAERFMQDFARAFDLDLAGFEAPLHFRDAARAGRFGWPLPVPMRFGVRMPIAVSTLAEAVARRQWPLRYPFLAPVASRDWLNWLLPLAVLPVLVALLLLLWRAG